MTARRLRPFVPRGSDDLLIQAAVAPVPQARAAWQDWCARRPLDEAGWAEVRMMPSVAARAGELAIGADLLPRLDGIRRFVWTTSQKQLLAARPILAHLIGHGVPVMLLKGAALMAAYPAALGRRFLRDVDILVPAARLVEAVELAGAAGWRNPYYPGVEEAALIGLARTHALEFKGPAGGEIDLHRFALAPNFCAGDDDPLWARAVAAQFLGLPCLRPAPEDLLVAALEHSFRRDPDQVLDWSLDAARLIGDPELDWAAVVEAVQRRNIAVPVEARLRYLGERCNLAVPGPVLAALAPHCRDRVFIDECLANQHGGLKLPGARRRARLRAQYRRAELHTRGSVAASPGRPVRTRPELELGAGGRRVDVGLPDGPIRAVRVEIEAAGVDAGWVCQVNCGAIPLRRLAGGTGWLARLRRRWFAGMAIDRRLFAAQGIDSLTLFILARRASPPIVVDSRVDLLPGGVVTVRLRLGR